MMPCTEIRASITAAERVTDQLRADVRTGLFSVFVKAQTCQVICERPPHIGNGIGRQCMNIHPAEIITLFRFGVEWFIPPFMNLYEKIHTLITLDTVHNR